MASKQDESDSLMNQTNQHIMANHLGLTPSFVKDNSDTLNKIEENVRKSLKYTNNDNPEQIFDRMTSLQRLANDTYQSNGFGQSLDVYASNKNNSANMTDNGFRSIFSDNEDRDDAMMFNFHFSIFSTYRSLISEYRNIARLIPEIHRGADMKARDILAINEITKNSITNVYSDSSINPSNLGEDTPANKAKNPINKTINEKVLEHYGVEDKLPRYFMTALIEGAKPVVVYPYSDIVEMAKYNVNQYGQKHKEFKVKSSNATSSEAYSDLLTEYSKKEKRLIPPYETFGRKYSKEGSEDIDEERSIEDFINGVVDKFVSKKDQEAYIKYGREDAKHNLIKKENRETSLIAGTNAIDKMELINQTHETYKDLIAKVKVDTNLEKVFKGQIFNAIKHIDDNVEFYNQSEAPMAMAINNLRKMVQFSGYSDQYGYGVTATNATLRKELIGKNTERPITNAEYGIKNSGPASVLDEYDDEFSPNSKSFINECLIKEYDAEDVIPVIISGKHIGYYVIETSPYTGNTESINKRNCNFTDMFLNLGINDDFAMSPGAGSSGSMAMGVSGGMACGGVANGGQMMDMGSMGASGMGENSFIGGMGMGMGGFNNGAAGDDALHRNEIMKRIIYTTLQRKLQKKDTDDLDDSFSDTMMSLIRDGAIVKNKIKIIYVPEKYMCYFTPELDGNGIPQSFMKDCLFTCYEKILVNMNNIMTRLTRTGTKDKITLNVGKAKNLGMSIRAIENALTTRKLNTQSPFSSLNRVLKSSSTSETIIEPIYDGEKLFDYEDISLHNEAPNSDEYEDKLTNQIVTSLKCPVTITNPYQEEDFASLAASRNAEYRFDVIKRQKTFGTTSTKFVRLLTVGSGVYKNLQKGNPNISLKDFNVVFSPPNQLNMKNSNDMFGTVSSYVDNIIDIIFDPDDDSKDNKLSKFEFRKKMFQELAPAFNLDKYIADSESIKNTAIKTALENTKKIAVNDFINNTKYEPLMVDADGKVTNPDNIGTGNDDNMGY